MGKRWTRSDQIYRSDLHICNELDKCTDADREIFQKRGGRPLKGGVGDCFINVVCVFM